ncbi:MAG: CaiB/BaiF CoA transferase family protein [Rhodospirillales bacterium]|jgi:formyl-CoA transferase
MPHVPAADVLDHIKVLDLTRVRSGPTCVRQLADWGADVIKVEMPSALEADGALGAPRHTPDFQNLQRNKRSLTLNLKEPDGLEIFKKLVKDADVVVENFRPDVKARLGIDYDTLAAINPRVILGSISGFGQDGPDAKRPGFDQIAQGMAGLMSITGEPGRGPMRVGIPIADLCSGIFCSYGILLAIIEREKSGKGQWVNTSLLQSLIFMLDFQAARWLVNQEIPGQAGNNHPQSMPTGVFKTKDGHMNLGVAGDVIWARFCKEVDKEVWIDDPKYVDGASRDKNRDQLCDDLNELFSENTTEYWLKRLNDASIPCGAINTIDQVFAEPQVEHLKIRETVKSEAMGDIELVPQPIRMNRSKSALKVAPPERGENTDEILSGLGFSEEQLAELRSRNVI